MFNTKRVDAVCWRESKKEKFYNIPAKDDELQSIWWNPMYISVEVFPYWSYCPELALRAAKQAFGTSVGNGDRIRVTFIRQAPLEDITHIVNVNWR